MPMTSGLDYERRLFHSLFATVLNSYRVYYFNFSFKLFLKQKDQKEGMTAFAEKRAPNFKHE